MDEMWSFVGNKGNPRRLWHAIDHHTGQSWRMSLVAAKTRSFCNAKRCSTPSASPATTPIIGVHTRGISTLTSIARAKRHTQKIERKHLPLRTRIKRLVRKTICFSKSTQMRDLVMGLFVNRYVFG